jgi:hypothetical protein
MCTCFAGLEHLVHRCRDVQPAESFYPRQLVMDMAFAALLVLALGALAQWTPAELGPEANAADTHFLPRP